VEGLVHFKTKGGERKTMSYFVYVSHKRPVEAFEIAEQLMKSGHYPFVPQLNKLIAGRKDAEWENYFKMWLLRCDFIFLTSSFREHERDWAIDNKISIVNTMSDLSFLKLPPFRELGREFGVEIAELLPEDEEWRKMSKDEAHKCLTNVAGVGANPLTVGLVALKAWDMQRR